MAESQPQRKGSAWLYIAGFIAVAVAGVMAFLLITRQRGNVEAATQQLTVETNKGPSVDTCSERLRSLVCALLPAQAHPNRCCSSAILCMRRPAPTP